MFEGVLSFEIDPSLKSLNDGLRLIELLDKNYNHGWKLKYSIIGPDKRAVSEKYTDLDINKRYVLYIKVTSESVTDYRGVYNVLLAISESYFTMINNDSYGNDNIIIDDVNFRGLLMRSANLIRDMIDFYSKENFQLICDGDDLGISPMRLMSLSNKHVVLKYLGNSIVEYNAAKNIINSIYLGYY